MRSTLINRGVMGMMLKHNTRIHPGADKNFLMSNTRINPGADKNFLMSNTPINPGVRRKMLTYNTRINPGVIFCLYSSFFQFINSLEFLSMQCLQNISAEPSDLNIR